MTGMVPAVTHLTFGCGTCLGPGLDYILQILHILIVVVCAPQRNLYISSDVDYGGSWVVQ